jgi:DNA-binding transcriptional LysR family regulator
VRLLDRNSQGVEVTEYGRVLLDGGAAVFDDLRQAVKDIKFLADPTAGEVRIGCSNILGANFVSAIGFPGSIRTSCFTSSPDMWRHCIAN